MTQSAAPPRPSLATPATLIDIGINLAHDSFDRDRDEVVQRAAAVGVTRFVITGSSVASTRTAIAMSQQDPARMRCTAGVHPHHAAELDQRQLEEIAALAAAPEVVAIGECGLDFFRNFSPREAQVQAFQAQLELAIRMRKPVFLHERDAHQEFVAILQRYRPELVGGVAHCFTGGLAEVRAYLDLGLYIGITGWICDERRGLHLREVVREIPAERLLLETDAPYLLPRDLQPKPQNRRNEPMYLPHVLMAVARARGQSPQELAAITTQNALTLFGWAADQDQSREAR